MKQTEEAHAEVSMLLPSRKQDQEVEVKHFTVYIRHFGIVRILTKSTERRIMSMENV